MYFMMTQHPGCGLVDEAFDSSAAVHTHVNHGHFVSDPWVSLRDDERGPHHIMLRDVLEFGVEIAHEFRPSAEVKERAARMVWEATLECISKFCASILESLSDHPQDSHRERMQAALQLMVAATSSNDNTFPRFMAAITADHVWCNNKARRRGATDDVRKYQVLALEDWLRGFSTEDLVALGKEVSGT